MKKYGFLFLVVLTLMFPFKVCAVTFNGEDGTKYYLEEYATQCDNITEEVVSITKYKDGFVYEDASGNYFFVKDDSCDVMNLSSTMEFFNSYDKEYYLVDDNYNLILETDVNSLKRLLVKTEDNTAVVGKAYYYVEISGGDLVSSYVENPTEDDFNNGLYEYKYFKSVDSDNYTINPDTDEYTIDLNGVYYSISYEYLVSIESAQNVQDELDAAGENIKNYYVMLDEVDILNKETIMTFTNQAVRDFIDKYKSEDINVSYSKDTKTGFLISSNPQTSKTIIIDFEGNIIGEFADLDEVDILENSLIVGNNNGEFVILDKGNNVLYTNEEIYTLSEVAYNNYVHTLYGNDNTPKDVAYKMYVYKLLSEDNLVINGKTNFEIKFSGLLNRLTSVKLTNTDGEVTLSENDFRKTSGSTIITLNKEYLSSLSEGKYTLTVGYSDGVTLSSTFEIDKYALSSVESEEANPDTFDGIGTSICIGIISLIGLLGTTIYLKKELIKG